MTFYPKNWADSIDERASDFADQLLKECPDGITPEGLKQLLMLAYVRGFSEGWNEDQP